MDTLCFEKEVVHWGDDEKELLCAKIIINGNPLIETVREYEIPYARKYGQENIAGGYIYVYAEYLYDLLCGNIKSHEHGVEVPVLICQCGCEGCWDFLVNIEEKETEIIWTGFHNPHRSSRTSAGGFWDYSSFPVFRFDKQKYLSAIMSLQQLAGK